MPGVPDAQQVPQLKRYPLRRHRIPIGNSTLSVVLPDDRAWLRKGTWAPSVVRGKEPPYWIRVWPASIALARQLVRIEPLRELRVLDLGCGVGIPGIRAAASGAATCFVDREADALAFARWNADSQPDAGAPATVQLVDWALEVVTGTFDLILLSDVSYHRSHHAPVRRQLAAALAPDGCVLHSDPHRELSSLFLRELQRDMSICERHVQLQHEGKPASVRLAAATANPEALQRWRERLGWTTNALLEAAPATRPMPGDKHE